MTAYQKRKDRCFKSGKCRSCVQPRDPKSMTFCTLHLEKHREQTLRSARKMREAAKKAEAKISSVKIKISGKRHKPQPTDDHPFKKQMMIRRLTTEERRRFKEQMQDLRDQEYRMVYNEYEGY